MVAIIKTGHSIYGIFNYNENKVKQGAAECIGEGNYPMDVDKMSDTMKLNRFLKQAVLNDNVKRNSVHISLNFDPSEKYSKEKLMDIANVYMEKVGFGEQPYLVYQHYDSGHPHIHITSIKVKADGSRIDMHNIGRNQSEAARKEIEKSFGLVVAEGRSKKQHTELQPISMGKVRYGKIQSKKAISNVLSEVLSTYKYASLTELNEVLKQYNVLADRGNEDSRIFKAKGLVYRILDENGKPTGVPIKASDFYYKPTLKFLEGKFTPSSAGQTTAKSKIKNAVDLAFLKGGLSLTDLIKTLEKDGIYTVFRKNAEGLIYGITYVDHTTKCVFNGSALGKEYSAKAIQERCISFKIPQYETTNSNNEKLLDVRFETPNSEIMATLFGDDFRDNKYVGSNTIMGQLADMLTQPEQAANYVSNQFKGKKKKKKRRGQSNNL